MTVQEILKELALRRKIITRQGLYIHLRVLKLKPAGVARPAIYPDDAAKKVIRRLGLHDRKIARLPAKRNGKGSR